ncbi:MAG: FAD-dependent monooxygenase, partial [Candidatus Eiseniibacteriota bacterium]
LKTALIVGSGIAGQTLAAALTLKGIACDIVEIKRDWSIVGAGMYVHGNALRALATLGIVDEILARGWHRHDDTTVVAAADGRVLGRPVYPRIAGPDIPAIVTIKRQALHEILHGLVRRLGLAVRMGVTVTAIDDRSPRGPVSVAFSDGRNGDYDLVIGADGINSTVRRLVFGEVAATFSGFANWRVTLPRPAAVDSVMWMHGPGTTFGIVPISADALYLGAVSREPGNPRYAQADLARLMREKFRDYGGLAGLLLAQVTDPESVIYTAIDEVFLPAPWYRGRTVVIGDAAHASTPFWAQGASMAIEDAVLLAELAGAGAAPETFLPAWMERRFARCVWVQRGSRETGERSHQSGDGVRAQLDRYLIANIEQQVAERYARLGQPI